MEMLPVYAISLAVCTLAELPLRPTLSQWLLLCGGAVLLARGSARVLRAHVAQRLLLLAASALWMVFWVRWVLAGAALPAAGLVFLWGVTLYGSARGVLIGGVQHTRGSVARWFSVGVVSLLLLFAFLARAGVTDLLPRAALQNLACAHFVLGLLLTAIDQQRAIYGREHVRPQLSAAFVMAFSLGLLVPIAAVLLVSTLMLGGLHALGSALAAVGGGVLLGLRGLWQVVLWLGQLLLGLLRMLGSASGSDVPHAAPGGSDASVHWAGDAHPWKLPRLPPDVTPAVMIALALLLMAAFAVALFRKPVRPATSETAEESTSVWSLQTFGRQWSAAWRAALARMRAQAGKVRLLPPATLHTMRDVYRAFLRWAERRGPLRSEATTPQELAEQLAHAFPDKREALAELTQHYERARYAERTPAQEELERARQLLRALSDDPVSERIAGTDRARNS